MSEGVFPGEKALQRGRTQRVSLGARFWSAETECGGLLYTFPTFRLEGWMTGGEQIGYVRACGGSRQCETEWPVVDEVPAKPVTKTLFTVLVVLVPKADVVPNPETDKLLLLTVVAAPTSPNIGSSKPTDKLLFVDKVAVPKADVLAKPLTEILFTEVVVAVPRFPAANTLEADALASA